MTPADMVSPDFPLHWQSSVWRDDFSRAIHTMSARVIVHNADDRHDCLEFQSALTSFLHLAMGVMRAERGNVQLVDPTDGALRIVVQHGFARPFLEFFRLVKNDKSACSAALSAARPIVIADVRTSPEYTDSTRKVMLLADAVACLSFPLIAGTQSVIGMISTHFAAPYRPTRAQIRRMAVIADNAVSVILTYNFSGVAAASHPSRLIEDLHDQSQPKTRIIKG
jgi:transcriptional regulator with GAF, ATPase, and Fis domain